MLQKNIYQKDFSILVFLYKNLSFNTFYSFSHFMIGNYVLHNSITFFSLSLFSQKLLSEVLQLPESSLMYPAFFFTLMLSCCHKSISQSSVHHSYHMTPSEAFQIIWFQAKLSGRKDWQQGGCSFAEHMPGIVSFQQPRGKESWIHSRQKFCPTFSPSCWTPVCLSDSKKKRLKKKAKCHITSQFPQQSEVS